MRAICVCVCVQASVGAHAAADAHRTPTDVSADPPLELAVTVYRDPSRAGGSIDLDHLDGFALVSETRMVRLPAGISRLRFDGVAEGIEPQSAIISGLPDAVMEKNRDAKVLSPSALLAATAGKPVELLRTNRSTGESERVAGTILSDADGGVVFQTSEGIEALRCSGLPESFLFEPADGPGARPSLSVLVRTTRALERKITVSYLSRGFDWAADYTATLSADERSMDLGAWVTLANANGVGFPSAHAQVVAGRVNRENDTVEPVDLGGPILARCWPRGSTSDALPEELRFAPKAAVRSMMSAPRAATLEALVIARRTEQEQLGDLKLYRVPERTALAGRQSKQVRLLDRIDIPVSVRYRATLVGNERSASFAADRMLRTVNGKANHLGVPLPSGRIAVFGPAALPQGGHSRLSPGERSLLLHESSLRDLAVGELVEIELGQSADVRVELRQEPVAARRRTARVLISSARATPILMELRLALEEDARVINADRPLHTMNGRPIFELTVPARGSVTLSYEIGGKDILR